MCIRDRLIIDSDEFRNANAIIRLKNLIKTRFVINQTEGCFVDFKRKEFPAQAADIYLKVFEAYKRKDKVDLMKYLSIPLYDIFKISIKENKQLPFNLYPTISDVQLMQARIYNPSKEGNSRTQTWHQLTMKFEFVNEEDKSNHVKYNVFERREADPSKDDWRLCQIE
eukprot:TRINITY_DN4352_c0_g1_i7.p1 TRINITY_DN4352_c0_g1~~TRINITY_DN4352_c0_g1_i7.p1  ORF type:complete len:168 (-),score=21.29 TRINITY_DN4352_c0_g1_i7:131-634(-)